MSNHAGQQLGNYRLLRLLGQGGFAEVYLGQHVYLESYAAIKVLHGHFSKQEAAKFLAEARTLVKLIHPHIVRLLDFGVEEDVPFLVMDYASNGTLRQLHPLGMQVALPTIITYVKQLADALQYAHNERIIHRDIKPENMLLNQHNTIVLSDFGIATIAQSSRYQEAQIAAGTILYMSPEQIQAHPRPASDQYALGIVVYEWLSGQRPFQGSFIEVAAKQCMTPPPPLGPLLPDLPPHVERVVMKALAKDPKERFANIQAFALALEQAGNIVANTTPLFLPAPPPGFEYPSSSSIPRPSTPLPAPPGTPSVPSEVLRVDQAATTPIPPISVAPPVNSVFPVQPLTPAPETPPSINITPNETLVSLKRKALAQGKAMISVVLPGKNIAGKRGNCLIVIAFCAVLTLVIGSYALINGVQTNYTASHTSGAPTLGSTATTGITVTPNGTATTQASATASAIANATPGVFGSAIASPQGTAYNDVLKNQGDSAANWDTSDNCTFKSDGYHIKAGHTFGVGNHFTACHETGKQFNNLAISVDMRILKGSSGGVLFRVDPGSNCCNGYMFEVDSRGRYKISANYTTNTSTLQDWTASSAIRQNAQTNTLQMLAHGNALFFYVNGTFLTTLTDTTFTASGDIGFSADSATAISNVVDTEVVFSNLQVSPQQ